jgi:hypothetical protein
LSNQYVHPSPSPFNTLLERALFLAIRRTD